MKLISEGKDSVLPRKELNFEINHSGKPTPNTNDIKEKISKNLKCNKDLIIIKEIKTSYGSSTSKVKSYIYENDKEMKILEKIKEEPKKEEVPKKEEKPAEKPEEKQDGEKSKTEE